MLITDFAGITRDSLLRPHKKKLLQRSFDWGLIFEILNFEKRGVLSITATTV